MCVCVCVCVCGVRVERRGRDILNKHQMIPTAERHKHILVLLILFCKPHTYYYILFNSFHENHSFGELNPKLLFPTATESAYR